MSASETDAFALCGDFCADIKHGYGITAAFVSYADYKAEEASLEERFAPFCDAALCDGVKRLYVPSLDLPDKTLDKLIDHALGCDAELTVVCSRTLTEAGVIDARFGKSPVMLLHEFGLLDRSTVISGVYLDKDDLALMAQEGAPLVLTPTSDAGHGYGVAPVCAAVERGVKLRIGTGDGAYNRARDVVREAALLRLLVSTQMNKSDAVPTYALAKMCLPIGARESDIKNIENKIING